MEIRAGLESGEGSWHRRAARYNPINRVVSNGGEEKRKICVELGYDAQRTG